jgi:hypothetical protein
MPSEEENIILIKRSSVSGVVPKLSSLELGELGLNTADGKIFLKTENETLTSIKTFLNSDDQYFVFNKELSSVKPYFGNNTVTQIFASVLGGYNNDISGGGSSVINGEDNDIESDFSLIGSGLKNKISLSGDYSFIAGGQNNLVQHENVFTLGSNLTSHVSNFTYVNNLSATGKIYGDGFELTRSLKYEEISLNADLQVNKKYILIANNFSPTVTLPQNPSFGDCIILITDVTNNNNVIINRNNHKINGIEDNLQYDIDAFFTLIYRNSEIGWKLYFK